MPAFRPLQVSSQALATIVGALALALAVSSCGSSDCQRYCDKFAECGGPGETSCFDNCEREAELGSCGEAWETFVACVADRGEIVCMGTAGGGVATGCDDQGKAYFDCATGG